MLKHIRSQEGRAYLVSRLLLLTIGAVLVALSVVIFLVPQDVAPSGLSGIAAILNELVHMPIGVTIILGNIPIQFMAYRLLGGWRTVVTTAYAVVVYSVLIDVLPWFDFVATEGVTDDLLLSSIFGGIIGGIGSGLIYRAGGTMGGTSTVARILRYKRGTSLSTSSLYTDSAIIVLAALTFGWESALYAVVALFVTRVVSDYILEGAGNTLSAFIVSEHCDVLTETIQDQLHHNVTQWTADTTGDHPSQSVMMVTVIRSEVNKLTRLINLVDEDAFVSFVKGQKSFGDEFEPFGPKLPLQMDVVDDGASELDTQHVRAVRQKYAQ